MPTPKTMLLQMEVPIIVRLAQTQMNMAALRNLAPGAIIELPKDADDDLDLMVNNRKIGHGTAVKVGENFGIRITSLGDQVSRAKAAMMPPPPNPNADIDAEAMAEALLSGQL